MTIPSDQSLWTWAGGSLTCQTHVANFVAGQVGHHDWSPDHRQSKRLLTANADPELGPSLWLSHMPETLLSTMSKSLHVGGDNGPLSPTQKDEERITLLDELESALISGDRTRAPNPGPSTITNEKNHHRWFMDGTVAENAFFLALGLR